MVFKYTQNWNDLRKMGNAKFVSSMYIWIFIVPIIAKMFEFIETDIINLVIFEQVIPFNTNLPFTWTMFYFSALFLALGNLIYIIKCPKIIKDHPSYQSYLDEGKQLKQLAQYSEDIDFDWSRLSNDVDKKISQIKVGRLTDVKKDNHKLSNMNKEDPVHYFWPIHQEADVKHIIHRTLCFYSFIIGFSLFGLVVFQNSITVIGFITK